MLRVLIHKEYISILKVYIPDYGVSSHMRQNWLQAELGKHVVGDFHIPFSIIDKPIENQQGYRRFE